jgi:cobalt/nickel transport system ATP-binding protein
MCFSVKKQEIVALCGPNGSGKSTLIEHLNGLLRPTRGRVWVNGKTVSEGDQANLWKEVGIVFQQSDDQLFAPTVIDDVMFGPLNLGMAPGEAKARAIKALETVGAGDLSGKLPNYLSGGQKRLISIAGILAMQPLVIAMDEPTSDLDPIHTALVESIIRDLRDRQNISVVIATHDLDLAARIADRICLVRNGAVYIQGTPQEIFYNPALVQEAGLSLPSTVRTYLDFCTASGTTPVDRPVRREELTQALLRIHKGI